MNGLLRHRLPLLFHRRAIHQSRFLLNSFSNSDNVSSSKPQQSSPLITDDLAADKTVPSFSSSSWTKDNQSKDNAVDNNVGDRKSEDGSGLSSWLDKVIYSSYLEKFSPPKGYKERLRTRFEMREEEKDDMVYRSSVSPPVSLKYLMASQNDGGGYSSPVDKAGEREETEVIQFPYKISTKTEFVEVEETDAVTNEGGTSKMSSGPRNTTPGKIVSVAEKLRKQEIDVESVLEEPHTLSDVFEAAAEVTMVDKGTPDPNCPPSSVACGGCGALLHCQDDSIPGYISSEKFKRAKKTDLMTDICYRCSILEAHQATLNLNVSTEDYPKIVSKIREKFAMVLLIVDLTDFPCSIWPGILDIIGTRRPIILIGNKVDLLPQDSPDYLKRVEESMIKCTVDIGMLEANIIHTALVSAKTGFGVEKLISTIFNLCKGKGDVFIMGCTNVGKSSLFNIFLQSDLCKPEASDFVQRATISQWPGTTLNLLKFPMTNPSGWKKFLRDRRLNAERPILEAQEKERKLELKETRNPELAVLTGHVGKTFISETKEKEVEAQVTLNDMFNINVYGKEQPKIRRPGEWNPDDHLFRDGYWVYDTPGAVNSNQILDLLTLPELVQSLPKSLIQPRTFYIKPEMSFFIGGLARLDFLEGKYPIRYTLFSNSSLPVTMSRLEDADEVYKKALGTKVFGVPSGGDERLSQFPPLEGKSYHLEGTGHTFSCADVVLSSIGWVAVTVGPNQTVRISVSTPNGKGIFTRQPALLPRAVNFKGKRVRGTYAYLPHQIYVAPKNRFNQKPQFRSRSY